VTAPERVCEACAVRHTDPYPIVETTVGPLLDPVAIKRCVEDHHALLSAREREIGECREALAEMVERFKADHDSTHRRCAGLTGREETSCVDLVWVEKVRALLARVPEGGGK
jgi:hypothetical protein